MWITPHQTDDLVYLQSLYSEFSSSETENNFAGTKSGISNHESVVLYVTGNLVTYSKKLVASGSGSTQSVGLNPPAVSPGFSALMEFIWI